MSQQNPIGYLKDIHERRHSLQLLDNPQPPFSRMQRVVSLDELIGIGKTANGKALLPRRRRLAIAVTLANSMLQLHTGPWLPEAWGKRDIHFLQGRDGYIHTEHPFLKGVFDSNETARTDSGDEQLRKTTTRACSSSLLLLGILILELWFNETIESQPFRNGFQDPMATITNTQTSILHRNAKSRPWRRQA
jgi:hypothetical protein